MQIIVAQCTQEKANTTAKIPAEERYMESELFKAQRRYCEAYADKWYILSGKHGLLNPWDRIANYDQHINDGWSDGVQDLVGSKVKNWQENHSNPLVELICGHEDYATKLIPFLEWEGIRFKEPFKGLGIGERTKRMKQEARKVENRSLDRYD